MAAVEESAMEVDQLLHPVHGDRLTLVRARLANAAEAPYFSVRITEGAALQV